MEMWVVVDDKSIESGAPIGRVLHLEPDSPYLALPPHPPACLYLYPCALLESERQSLTSLMIIEESHPVIFAWNIPELFSLSLFSSVVHFLQIRTSDDGPVRS